MSEQTLHRRKKEQGVYRPPGVRVRKEELERASKMRVRREMLARQVIDEAISMTDAAWSADLTYPTMKYWVEKIKVVVAKEKAERAAKRTDKVK